MGNPEFEARQQIDELLAQAGWLCVMLVLRLEMSTPFSR